MLLAQFVAQTRPRHMDSNFPAPDELGWFVLCGGLVALYMGFGIGANDVANAFGTSLGSGALTSRGAVYAAGVFEFLGAALFGSAVAQTIASGIIDTSSYDSQEGRVLYMIGMFSSLLGAGIWLNVATWLKAPVSTTHAIVGGLIGFSVITKGIDSVLWSSIGSIAASWVISPVISGVIAALGALGTFALLKRDTAGTAMIGRTPIMAFGVSALVTLFLIYSGPKSLGLSETPLWMAFLVAAVLGIVGGVSTKTWMVPRLMKVMECAAVQMTTMDKSSSGPGSDLLSPASVNEETRLMGSNYEPIVEQVDEFDEQGDLGIDHTLTPREPSVAENNQPSATSSLSPRSTKSSGQGKHGEVNGVVNQENETFGRGSNELHDENTDDHDLLDSSNKEEALIVSTSASGWLGLLFNRLTVVDKGSKAERGREFGFSLGQIVVACLKSFAHGANDTANAIGPFAAMMAVVSGPLSSSAFHIPTWVLIMGGISIVIGLAAFGSGVMETIGGGISRVTPSRGLNMDLATALTVLAASQLGFPVSTTHATVGAVVGVGLADGPGRVQWNTLTSIFVTWIVTLPVAAVIAAVTSWILEALIIPCSRAGTCVEPLP